MKSDSIVKQKKVFYNKPIESCYGCQACYQVCPKHAITMQKDEAGFLYPEINNEKCIDCGLCEKVCPTQEHNIANLFHPELKTVYALWNKDLHMRLNSTSGGAFYVIAKKFILENGIVYGVDYSEDLAAFHKRIINIEDLKRIQGSKYMQSDVHGTFVQVKEDLKKGYKVLYSGTPCQIAGLRLYLRKEYSNLYTIDLVCHGVPSSLFFQEHKKYLENVYNDKLVDFKFRSKKKSGWRSYTKYVFTQRKPVYKMVGEDFYSHLFHLGCLSRESCFSCSFSRSQRVGDITLSDFWGGEKYLKELKKQRKYGFNMLMCNTNSGIELLKKIVSDVEIRQIPFEYAKNGDIRLRQPGIRPLLRNNIYQLLQDKGYRFLLDKFGLKVSFIQKIVPLWLKNTVKEIQSKL